MQTIWSYEGKGSPEHWGELSEQWQTCKKGMYQSPINISHPVSANLPLLVFNFHTNVKLIVNNGHTIQITVHDEDDFLLDGQTWNSPSENHINGQSFPLELHFVHANSQGELAVLAVMLTPGKTNPALDILLDVLPTTAHQEQALQQDMMLEKRFPQADHYYRFSGSLITPPCTEGVIWLVMKQPVEASHAQLARFAKALRNANNRPLLPLHGRQITE